MKACSFLLFLSFAHVSLAQTVLNNNPPSVKWYQVTTPHFNVLFPEGFDEQAKRMANRLEHVHLPESKTLTTEPRKISVVMQGRSSESNAFVSITPRRTEFYSMPSQNYNFIGNNDWFDLVGVHEFRHVVQFDHAKQGFNKFIYLISGNYGLSSLSNLAVPRWFWEGDAVCEETALTRTGRGRIPNFGLVFRTNFLEGRTFNYHKQLLGSYKNSIPNEYVLGYHMVSYLRKRTGDPLIWDKITSRAWSNSIIPFTFSNAIRKETGLPVTKLFNEMASDLKKEWEQSIDQVTLSSFNTINIRRSDAYTDYLYPQVTEKGIIVMKSGIGDIDQLILLESGDEKKVFVQGIVNESGMLSAAGSKVVWNEYRFDPRWQVQNYSTIVIYDLQTRKKKTLSSPHTRYAGAALSPDGKQIVTIETDRTYRHKIIILNLDGSISKQFDNPENYFYSMPRWSDDGSRIVTLKTTPDGKTVTIISVNEGTMRDIFPLSSENVGSPVIHDHFLLYNSPINGIDNIYAYDLQTSKKYQVTDSRYGAYNPVISRSHKSIFYNEQTRDGMDVARTPFDPESWREITSESISPKKQLSDYVVEQEANSKLLENIPSNNYPVTKYSKLKGLINPYTWGPFVDNSLTFAEVGIASQDVLSTTSINAGYQFDIYERTGAWHAGFSYQGWYPIINFDVSYGDRKQSEGLSSTRDVDFKWKENNISAGVLIPLVLTKSKYLTSINVSNDVGFTLTSSFSSRIFNPQTGGLIEEGNDRFVSINSGDTLFYQFNDITDYGQLIFNHFAANYAHFLKQSKRDFNPKFGQYIAVDYFDTPFGGDYQGWQWTARGYFYFPGLFKHHSLLLRGGYQESLDSYELDAYAFRNYLFKPRGYSYPNDSRFTTLSANYAFPLWYPDISLGPIVNIQRVKANLFYDYGKGEGYDYYHNFDKGYILGAPTDETYKSYGAELTVDLNIFRLIPQFELGFRASRIEANGNYNSGWVYEFLIGNIPF
ncbi:MAG TPA: hypothetical protein VFW11_23520 [Cyclobacteriaceae bacterium]|nr:hypothetical protein [Cyclobacteriaceae bacterium]